MIGLFIAFASCIYFFLEAKKRSVSPFKWALIAFVAFMGPQVLVSWILVPVVLVMLGIPSEESLGIVSISAFGALAIGFWLLVLARKRLYLHARTEPAKDAIPVGNLEIESQPDGTYKVADRSFKTRKDAEEFVDFTQSLRQ